MSVAAPVRRKAGPATEPRHPNELDLRRIERALEQRQRYRYVRPTVLIAEHGYRVRSPCCSRNVDPLGGEIDVALICWDAAIGEWRLLARNHAMDCWIEDGRFARLPELLARLNADPERRFWQ